MKKTLAFFLGLAIATPMFASEVAEPTAEPAAAPQNKVEEILAKLPVKVSGYLQTGWNWTDAGAGSSSFQAKRLRLMVDGKVSNNISFRLQVEAFNGVKSGKALGDGNPGQKDLQVMDAFATWKIKPQFQLRAGQFYTPMGFENYDISPASLETVDFSNICYQMACRNAIGYNYIDYGRDLGVMVLGDLLPQEGGYNLLSYNVVLSNGSLPCKDDNNKSKDLIGAITVRPIKHLMIKGAYNWGEYSNAAGKYLPMNRFIAGAWYNNPTGLDVRAEYGMIKSDKGNVDEEGAYVLVGWHAGKWLPVARWDMYKDKKGNLGEDYNRILAGVSYELCKNVKFQANYLHKMPNADGAKSSNQIQIMGLFKF